LLAHLEETKPLSNTEEREVMRAIESTGIPNGVDRMLASMSANTLKSLLARI